VLQVSQIILQPLHFVEVVNPHAECGLQRVEQQMVKEDEKDKHERAKLREQQRKRQTLLDQREHLETAARLTNAPANRSSMSANMRCASPCIARPWRRLPPISPALGGGGACRHGVWRRGFS